MKKTSQKGFTLIEIMVATSIFMIIMLAAIGSLLVASNSAKKAKALQAAMDNVNSAMDTMSRSLRLGSNYECLTIASGSTSSGTIIPNDCPFPGGSAIVFLPSDPTLGNMSFQLVQKTASSGVVNTVQKCTTSGCLDVTSPDVNVDDLHFVVRGSDPLDGIAPSVFVMMKGTVVINGKSTTFAVQTLASQRDAE